MPIPGERRYVPFTLNQSRSDGDSGFFWEDVLVQQAVETENQKHFEKVKIQHDSDWTHITNQMIEDKKRQKKLAEQGPPLLKQDRFDVETNRKREIAYLDDKAGLDSPSLPGQEQPTVPERSEEEAPMGSEDAFLKVLQDSEKKEAGDEE